MNRFARGIALPLMVVGLGLGLAGCSTEEPAPAGGMESGKMSGAMEGDKMKGSMGDGKMSGSMEDGKMKGGAMEEGKMAPETPK